MPFKLLMTVAAIAVLALSGCASSGESNTTYAQWLGPSPQPDFGATEPGSARIEY